MFRQIARRTTSFFDRFYSNCNKSFSLCKFLFYLFEKQKRTTKIVLFSILFVLVFKIKFTAVKAVMQLHEPLELVIAAVGS